MRTSTGTSFTDAQLPNEVELGLYSQCFSEEHEGPWNLNLLVGGEMSSFDRSLRWLIAIAVVLAGVGLILSIIGSSPGGIVMSVIVIVACAFVWLREKRKRDHAMRSDSQ